MTRTGRTTLLLVFAATLMIPSMMGASGAQALTCARTVTPSDAPTLPAIVSQASAGTVFCLAAGTYDMRDVIKPRAGDQFLGAGSGASGTILRGAATLTGWSANNGVFVHSGGVVALPRGGTCFGGGTACQYPDWVYVDGTALRRVLAPCTATSVVPGTFCIDYASKTIALGQDPSGHLVEYSFVPQAIVGSVIDGVTVADLQVTKYANAAKGGAAIVTGPSWFVNKVDVNDSHSCGIAMPGSGTVVQASRFHDNGQFGFCSSGGSVGGRFVGNEVDHNNTLGFDTNAGAGGGKFTGTLNLLVSGNDVHDNNGTGIWLDADDKGAQIVGNTSEGNTDLYGGGDGIKIEVSCDVVVTGNTALANARDGIQVLNSQRVTVGVVGSGNIVTAGNGTSYGILVRGTHRAGDQAQCGPGSQGLTVDNRVEGNDITLPAGSSGWNGVLHGSGAQMSRNSFAANAYHVPDCAARRWKWWTGTGMTRVPFAGAAPNWQGFAQDSPPAGTCSAA